MARPFPKTRKAATHDRKGYREFRDDQADRRTVVYVGARDGMLHAFDAGAFRWGDNPCTDVSENRGYFQWTDPGDRTRMPAKRPARLIVSLTTAPAKSCGPLSRPTCCRG